MCISIGFKKKLRALAKTADGAPLNLWISSIVNHLYWCVMSTPPEDGDVLLAKWCSIVDHVQNIHDGFGEPFPQCVHGPLEGRERQKPWLEPGMFRIHVYNVQV